MNTEFKSMIYNKKDKEMDNMFQCWYKIGRVLAEHKLELIPIMEDGEPAYDLVPIK